MLIKGFENTKYKKIIFKTFVMLLPTEGLSMDMSAENTSLFFVELPYQTDEYVGEAWLEVDVLPRQNQDRHQVT